VEFGEPGLDLLPEEAISTSTRTLLASLGVADPGDGGPWGWRAVTLVRQHKNRALHDTFLKFGESVYA